MKQGTLITKIVMLVLFAAVVIYLAIYAVQSLTDPLTTVIAYQDSLDDSVEATGVLVREETVLSSGSDIMDILPDEGERVAAGETIAILYQSSDALERQKQLQSLEQQLEQLQSAVSSSGSAEDTAKLEQQIISSILALRSGTASGDLSSLESNALSLRTQVLQWEYTYASSDDSADTLTDTLSSLTLQISQLSAQSSSDTTSIYAPCSGLFSGLVDGYEQTLTPDVLDTITAAQLSALSAGTSSADTTSVGKLITGDRWYFATVVDSSTADRLQEGDVITVGFSRDFTGEVSMRVERVGQQEEEGCVLVLSSMDNLKDVTMLRFQTVELIFTRYTGIRVPKQAVRMEYTTTTDPDTGETVQSQLICVYTLVSRQAERKQVKIVAEGSDYYLVTPVDSSDSTRLRAGDSVIVTAEELYDGKVIIE